MKDRVINLMIMYCNGELALSLGPGKLLFILVFVLCWSQWYQLRYLWHDLYTLVALVKDRVINLMIMYCNGELALSLGPGKLLFIL